MAMTKKEKDAYEAALTAAALRTTADVKTDVTPPAGSDAELSKGWAVVAETSEYARVEVACSSSIYHSIGKQDKTDSQRPKHLYSTKLLALKALRRAVEKRAAEQLRRVDRMIEEEGSNAEVSGLSTRPPG